MKNNLIFIFIIIISQYALATVITIPENQPTIQAGINSADIGDTILVSPGTYLENIKIINKSIVLASYYIINEDPIYIKETTIDGSNPINPDSASTVIISSNSNTAVTLLGFTITGGLGTKFYDEETQEFYREGGGILTYNTFPHILYNFIINNQATDTTNVMSAGGGGICTESSTPLIRNNIIKYNKGRYGAGIALSYSTGIIRNNIIAKNSGGQDFGGGGIWAYFTYDVEIINNTIVENHCFDEGIHKEYGAGKGGGMLLWEGNHSVLNNIIWYNTQTASSIPVHFLQIPPESASFRYNNMENYPLSGTSESFNIYVLPKFADSSYVLTLYSPCVDMGFPADTHNDPEQETKEYYARYPSRGWIINDLGAYGGPYACDLTSLLVTNIKRDEELPMQFTLYQNYPNPFNPITAIRYTIPIKAHVKLTVFNILGEEITTLVDANQHAGQYHIEFDGKNLQSGVYLYQLKTKFFEDIKKFTIIK